MAVPSILMVAPSGRTKEATSLSAPSFSVHSRFRGSVPTEEAEENAMMIAGIMPLKKVRGLMPPRTLTEAE